jgi:hypothetical protein
MVEAGKVRNFETFGDAMVREFRDHDRDSNGSVRSPLFDTIRYDTDGGESMIGRCKWCEPWSLGVCSCKINDYCSNGR